MKKLLSFLLRRDVSRGIWVTGLGLVAIGQTLAASNNEYDDTMSEFVEDQSDFAKMVIFVSIGAVLSHWAKWIIMRRPPTTIVQADNIEHLEVKETN